MDTNHAQTFLYRIRELEDQNHLLKKTLVWLYEAYQQECAMPLDALENSLIHKPIIEEAVDAVEDAAADMEWMR